MDMGLNLTAVQLFLCGITTGAAVIAIYVKLSFSNFVITVLNGRYPTAQFMNEKFSSVEQRISKLEDSHQNQIDRIDNLLDKH